MKDREEIKKILLERQHSVHITNILIQALSIVWLFFNIIYAMSFFIRNPMVSCAWFVLSTLPLLAIVYYLPPKLVGLVCKIKQISQSDKDVLYTSYKEGNTLFILPGKWSVTKCCDTIIKITSGGDFTDLHMTYLLNVKNSFLKDDCNEYKLTEQQYNSLCGLESDAHFLELTGMETVQKMSIESLSVSGV